MSNTRTTRVRPRRARRVAATTAAAATAALSLVGPGSIVTPFGATVAGAAVVKPHPISFNHGFDGSHGCPINAQPQDFENLSPVGNDAGSYQRVRVCWSMNQGNIQIDQIQLQWYQAGCFADLAGNTACWPFYDVNEITATIEYDNGPASRTVYDYERPDPSNLSTPQPHPYWRQYTIFAANRQGPTGLHARVRLSSSAYNFDLPGENESNERDPNLYDPIGSQAFATFDIRVK